MSKRPDITAKLSQLVEKRLDSQNMYWSPEVNFDGGKERVDFVGFHSKLGAPEAVAVDLGRFEFYEVKSSMADFTSGHGLTFYGDKNFLVCLPELAQQLVEQQAIPERVDMILCPDKSWKRLVPKIDHMRIGLHRERTAAEMLWAIVKAHRESEEVFDE